MEGPTEAAPADSMAVTMEAAPADFTEEHPDLLWVAEWDIARRGAAAAAAVCFP